MNMLDDRLDGGIVSEISPSHVIQEANSDRHENQ